MNSVRRTRPALLLAPLYIATALILIAIWALTPTQAAYAYVDPSVMTYTIQALAGVAVALSAIAGVVFRRVRRRVLKTLNIDENTNKVREGSIARFAVEGDAAAGGATAGAVAPIATAGADPSPAATTAADTIAAADERARMLRAESAKGSEVRGLEKLDASWLRRFAFALLISVFAFFIILVAPALEIIAGNSDSLVFGLQSVWWISALINGVLAVAVAALLATVLRGKRFTAVLLFIFCLGFASYVQALFLNAGMMPADGGYIGWTEWYFVQKMIISGIVWLIILVVPQIVSRAHRMTWLKVTSALAVALIIMQGVGVGSVAIESAKQNTAERPYVTESGLYSVSSQQNVIMFVLDTYDTVLLEQALVDDPSALDEFTDFTFFPDCTGTMVPTANAVPYLLSGEKPAPDEELEAYRRARYERGKLLPALRDAGYDVGLYTDSTMFDYGNPHEAELALSTRNIRPLTQLPIDVWQTYLVMDQMALYRQAPWFAKPLFWYYTTDVNNRMIGEAPEVPQSSSDSDRASMGPSSGSAPGADQLYELDDAGILAHLRESGLMLEESDAQGAFRFIHLFGPHFPFWVDENGNDVGNGNSDQERQALGSLKAVSQYLAELKKLGVYDRTTIIVTADHGVWSDRVDPSEMPVSPILLVKPATPEGSPQEPYRVSDAPVDHDDIAPTIMAALGASPQEVANIGSGLTVWQVENAYDTGKSDGLRKRTYDALTRTRDENGQEENRFVEYEISGNVEDPDSWKKTGTEWPGA